MNNTHQEVFQLAEEKGYINLNALKNLDIPESHDAYVLLEATLIQRWLRETHDLQIVIMPFDYKGKTVYDWSMVYDMVPEEELDNELYPTYEAALIDALYEALEALPVVVETVVVT